MINKLKKDLRKLADPIKAKNYARFFKTGKGEYGEGDKFLGVIVPQQRKIAVRYKDLGLADLQKLLSTNIHEYRLTALFILVNKYRECRSNCHSERSEESLNVDLRDPSLSLRMTNGSRQKEFSENKKIIVSFYLKNTKNINNWDLVDSSAHYILGDYLLDKKDRSILYKLAKSKNLWERRIAVISTFAFIRDKQFEDALKIVRILLNDKHDLIHKAVGWMLREVGKRDLKAEEEFLRKYYKQMPRTMLRYAIEKFEENKRRQYLAN